MVKKEELEIHILKNGEVKVDIKGGQGKNCLNYIKLFEQVLGSSREKQFKPEYYEPEPKIRIDVQQQ